MLDRSGLGYREQMNRILALLFVAVGMAVAWFAWLAWDDTGQVDSSGNETGPYEAWQVIASAITVLVVVLLASRFAEAWFVAPVAGIAYAASWGFTLIPEDDTGLAFVGLIMVLVGVTMVTFLVAFAGTAIWRAIEQRHELRRKTVARDASLGDSKR